MTRAKVLSERPNKATCMTCDNNIPSRRASASACLHLSRVLNYRKGKKGNTFWLQFYEKPSIIAGCPGSSMMSDDDEWCQTSRVQHVLKASTDNTWHVEGSLHTLTSS